MGAIPYWCVLWRARPYGFLNGCVLRRNSLSLSVLTTEVLFMCFLRRNAFTLSVLTTEVYICSVLSRPGP